MLHPLMPTLNNIHENTKGGDPYLSMDWLDDSDCSIISQSRIVILTVRLNCGIFCKKCQWLHSLHLNTLKGILYVGIDIVPQHYHPARDSDTVLETEFCHSLQEITATPLESLHWNKIAGFLHAGIDFVPQDCPPAQDSDTVLETEFCHSLQEIAATGVSPFK